MSVAVEVRKVSKTFGHVKALDDVSLLVAQGEVVVLIGTSGSGKSTLLRIIAGLETPSDGSVRITAGTPVESPRRGVLSWTRRTAHRTATVGMVFQHFNLYPHLTALDNVAVAPIHAYRIPKKVAHERALEHLTKVGLASHARHYPGQLSGGQQQRVAIARALATNPDTLLFDEPTSALDPETTGEVLAVMRSLAHAGMTMIIATHEMAFAREVSDRVVFMGDGQVIETGASAEFFARPRTGRACQFLRKFLLDQEGDRQAELAATGQPQ